MKKNKRHGFSIAVVSAIILSLHAFILKSTAEAESFVYQLIALAVLSGLSFIWCYFPWTPKTKYFLPFCIIGALLSLIFLPAPYGWIGAICILPLIRSILHVSNLTLWTGTFLGLSCAWIGYVLPEYQAMVYSGFLGIHAAWILFSNKNDTYPYNSNTDSLEKQTSTVLFLLMVRSLSMAIMIILIVLLPIYGSSYHYFGYVFSFLVVGSISRYYKNLSTEKSTSFLLLSLFVVSFLFVIALGFYARIHTWYGLIFSSLLVILAGHILLVTENLLFQYIKKPEGKREKKQVIVLVLIFIFSFLILQIPASGYWFDRLVEVAMPEALYNLALGQYLLKNLTLLAVLSTACSGYIYLKRRGIQ